MLFNSIEFAVFLPIVLGLYYALRKVSRQNLLLLAASYVFYGAWDWRFLSLLLFSTLIDYFAGSALGKTDDERRRKLIFFSSVGTQLVILAFFKYFGFFVESAVGLLSFFGLEPNAPLLEILLPVGISFYTFQTISYTFDVYRRRMDPAKNFVNFATFVSYFPQLVAGPIERAQALLPQIETERPRPNSEQIRSGLTLMLMGLFKKVAIADAVAPIVNRAFEEGSGGGKGLLVLGVIGFALQIYGDFCGYTDIARGTSRLFGIELMRNFEQPYLSRSITEFWRTWHISLSSWLHDYLYVPLGGNKNGKAKTYRNLLLTMLLGGLWHGAAWTFVVWGGLHGLFLAIHRAFGGYVARGSLPALRWRQVPAILGTFALVSLLWVFFRADTLSQATDYLTGLVTAPWGSPLLDDVLIVGTSLLFVLCLDLSQRLTGQHAAILRWPAVARGAATAVLVLSILVWTGGSSQPFIYFQF